MISLTELNIKKRQQGFTIVELLIVIVVIGILALLVVTTYSGIQQKARNSKRQADLSTIQTQLEAFYSQNGYYPSLANMKDDTWLGTNMKSLDKGALVDPSNPTKSNDPVSGDATNGVEKVYVYNVANASDASCESDNTKCAKYTLVAQFEGKVNNESTVSKSNLD